MNGTYATDETILAVPDLLVGIGPLIAGIAVVLFLILAVVYGRRMLRRGDEGISTPSERPENPRGYEEGVGEPDEMLRNGERRMPHDLYDHERTVTRPPGGQPRRWSRGGSGFGSGGPGSTGG